MIAAIRKLPRYVVCGRVTKRPIFEFVSSTINPNDALMVFPYDDDYSFGILQSGVHWGWFTNRCSTLKRDFRYTSNTVFDTFPWPQGPTASQVKAVAKASRELRELRRKLMATHKLSLRELYRSLDQPGEHPLRGAHEALDDAVREAYGMGKRVDALAYLFAPNERLAADEDAGVDIVGPGLPPTIRDRTPFVTKDRVTV
jgi:hypothetical protein